MIYKILMLSFFISTTLGADVKANPQFEKFITTWTTSWNTTDSKEILNMINGQGRSSRRARVLYLSLIKEYGKIKSTRFLKAYDDNTVYSAEIEFENNFKSPFLFQFNKNTGNFKFFFPGQNPELKRNDKEVEPFIKKWTKTWNEKSPKDLLKLIHSKSKFNMNLKTLPKEQVSILLKTNLFDVFGDIKDYKIIGYKARTNEYIVSFNYSTKGAVAGALIIKKDNDDQLKLFNFDIDGGKRALERPKTWNPQ